MTANDTPEFEGGQWKAWLILACVLIVAAIALRYFSADFGPDIKLRDMPIVWFAALYCLLNIACISTLPGIIRRTPSISVRPVLIFIIAAGLAMRLISFGGPTVLEDDYNRYLWDGAVTASGENPYRYSPLQITENPDQSDQLHDLQKQAGTVFEHINYPQFSTVYPPVAQAVFSIAHWIAPFSLDAWRLVLLVLEIGCLSLIIGLLYQFEQSPLWASLYWWNPLVIKEIANSAHMEPLLILPLLAAVYLALKNRLVLSSLLLAIAAGVKIWPALVAAAIFRRLLSQPRLLVIAGLVMACIVAALLWPIVAAGLNSDSGFVAFAQHWNASSAAYLVSEWLSSVIVAALPWTGLQTPLIARGMLGLALLGTIALICLRPAAGGQRVVRRMFLISAAVYLLAPTQTPWYFLWIAPFLCIYPERGLMLAGALIPLHYTYFHLAARGLEDVYHLGVVWLIWLPVWALLIFDAVREGQFPFLAQGQRDAA